MKKFVKLSLGLLLMPMFMTISNGVNAAANASQIPENDVRQEIINISNKKNKRTWEKERKPIKNHRKIAKSEIRKNKNIYQM